MTKLNKNFPLDLFNLDKKIIVVTGAGGLLGKMHVDVIAAFGGIPILVDINTEALKELKNEIYSKYSIESIIYRVDITNENEVSKSAEDIFKKFGRIDGLINNAAINPAVSKNNKINFSRLENFDLQTWNQDIAVGITGSFLCTKHYGYKISLNESGGSIINISSDLGIIAPDQRIYRQKGIEDAMQPVKPISYSVIKSSLLGLSRYVSTYWADKNVRSNCLLPGGVLTDQDDIFVSKLSKLIPLERMASHNEYQGAIVFLLSDASSYMTGSCLVIDGGRSAW